MSSREEFEAWASKQKLGLTYGDCGYVFSSTEMAWRAWQATEDKCAEKLAESDRYGRAADITIENLEVRLAAMAAENAGLKNFIISDCHVAHIEPETFYEEEVTRYVSADGYEPETPATDAYQAEVRAQGVEMFAEMYACEAIKDGDVEGWKSKASNAASEYADQLRQEAAQ